MRAFDVVTSSAALVLLSPVFAAVSVAIKLDSAGPVFFRQRRVGLGGRPFRIHKFRTMTDEVPRVNISATGDPRVTRVGRVLRKTKLDELPQLIDVVRGEMALVGPRPEVPEYVQHWPAKWRHLILSVRPGITDPASIRYRNEADKLARADDPERYYIEVILPQKTRLYAKYVRERSTLGDLKIIAQTLRAVLRD
ncbi:sugar transferase [Gleimia hominis]|uniref:sugar transferase n=1 Tax=Gleimia hominis TaxID=595468 RepID=UPI0011AEF052|nr:sugar transferase [Gleimia hominis]WIK64633.1 sugar transferase [Gleimia hominis]